MAVELVVFDLAGTTVHDDDAVNHCFRAALADGGAAVSAAAVNEVMGLPKPQAIRLLLRPAGESEALEERVRTLHADFVARMIRFYRTDPSVREIAGASETFRRLRAAGIRVALDTGFSRAITDVLLARMGWAEAGLVDASVCSDEVARGRPYPDMVRALMRRLGVADPQSVAKVGDTPADLQEGENAGCGLVIGVTGGSHRREQLEPFPHTHLIGTVADLPPLLGL